MGKITKTIVVLLIIMASITSQALFVSDEASAKHVVPIYNSVLEIEAENNIVETTFFGNMEDSDGCGVYTILNLVLTIFTFGVGIAAAIGISIAGVTYLTSKGNIEQTNKAKRRIFEIVIGIAFYVVILAAANFLLPEFNTDFKACKTLSNQEVANRKAQEAAARARPSPSSRRLGRRPPHGGAPTRRGWRDLRAARSCVQATAPAAQER